MTQATVAVGSAAPQASTQVSTREVPWMKLGRLVDKPMTATEAAQAGGLDFNVVKCPLRYEIGDTWRDLPERTAVVREDTGQWLGIMSKDYPVLQYWEAFDFMDHAGSVYVACGGLKGGRQGFMVVEAPEKIKVLGKEDPHTLYLVLRTSHDGSRAVEVSVMPLRGRCMNQLTLRSFTKGVEHRWAVKHTTSMHAKLAEAKKSLENLGAYAKAYEGTASRLVKLQVTEEVARELVQDSLPARPKRDEQVAAIIDRWHTSQEVGFDWTGWGLVNAVSEYFEWGRAGGSPESRFIGALQGQTHAVINRVAGRLLSRA